MKTIAYQGVAGAYSEQACKNAYPNLTPIAYETFIDAMLSVENGEVDLAMIPLENSTAGRVEEIYRLIPKMKLHIIAEHYEPVVHYLLGLKGSKISDLTCVGSHPQALAQCQENISKLNLKPVAKLDTAGAAKDIKMLNDKNRGAIASKLASEIYDLEILKEHFEDVSGNITRFFILSRKNIVPKYEKDKEFITSLIFEVRDIPAALYKALGGFATNSINLLKIESYMHSLDDESSFHIDIDGHIEEKKMLLALQELRFFAQDIKILGTYKKSINL
jgi:prephenate dehydratase